MIKKSSGLLEWNIWSIVKLITFQQHILDNKVKNIIDRNSKWFMKLVIYFAFLYSQVSTIFHTFEIWELSYRTWKEMPSVKSKQFVMTLSSVLAENNLHSLKDWLGKNSKTNICTRKDMSSVKSKQFVMTLSWFIMGFHIKCCIKV